MMKLLLLVSSSTVASVVHAAWILPQQNHQSITTKTSPRAFIKNKPSSSCLYSENKDDDKGGSFNLFPSPYESKIPDELKDEIYRAEANTPAAKERGQRVALYALIAFVGIFGAFFNGFLTELRAGGVPAIQEVQDSIEGVVATAQSIDTSNILADAGFGWVEDNFLFKFLFLNKIGGGLTLLLGGGAGLLAEAELDTKRINAEKIYDELVRRKEAKTKKESRKKAKRSQPRPSTAGSKKKGRMSGKAARRMAAMAEVVGDVEESTPPKDSTTEATDDNSSSAEQAPEETKEESKDGIFGKVKEMYDKADQMAASQALLMNKKLEDAGVVEKITDETGLKVIGKEAAAKLQEGNKQK